MQCQTPIQHQHLFMAHGFIGVTCSFVGLGGESGQVLMGMGERQVLERRGAALSEGKSESALKKTGGNEWKYKDYQVLVCFVYPGLRTHARGLVFESVLCVTAVCVTGPQSCF